MKQPIRTFLLAVITASSGCVTGIPTVPSSEIGKGSFMCGTWYQDSVNGRDAYYVVSVNGALVQKPTRMKDWDKPFSIGSGERWLVIDYEGIDPGALSRPRLAKATVRVTLVPGVTYAPDGRDEGRTVALWIKRMDTDERICAETVALREDMQFARPLFVPAPTIKK